MRSGPSKTLFGKHATLAVALALAAVPVAVAAAAWLSTPGVGDLGARVGHRLAGTGGPPVGIDRVSPLLREAVVATEDERFYRHHGIDVIGLLRALPYDVSHLSLAQGASTITEQTAKLLYLGGNDHTIWRKLEDMALAVKLESSYPKDRILDAYLDSAYFGEGAYGVRAAAERYFGRPPSGLGLARASLLAGLVQAPSAYDPFRSPAAARARQVAVLRSLVRNGYVTEGEAAAALARPLPLRGAAALPPVTGVRLGPGPAFVWWELGVGAGVCLAGVAVLLLARRLRLRPLPARIALRAVALALLLAGAAAVVRSFRVA